METVSAIRQICKRPQPPARCTGSTNQPTKVSSDRTVTDGFLRHQFLPLLEKGKELPDQESTQKDFFESLAILTKVYGLQTLNVADKSYPYNILLAHQYAKMQLSQSVQDIEVSILTDDTTVKLATQHTYHTGMTLFYIPVLPLYRLLQDTKQKKNATLLLSVFAYLYHIAGIPYYRDDYSALAYYYQCMEEGLMEACEEDDTDEKNSLYSACNAASHYGDCMHRKIFNPHQLNQFRSRIARHQQKSSFDRDCLSIAKKVCALWQEYPSYTVFRSTSNLQLDEDEGIISAQQYISFVAENNGILYEHIARMVNDEFNECSEMEQPTLLQVYDKQHNPPTEGLDFEYRLFPLINDLCTLLNQIP
ncbi:hypothetical protein [Flavobacterium yafengii]|uniref:hypothetical protein n=1 Tax=Flavobacterium yafengii TaxID=3041253 RepID=UPI0024A839BB|nr:hypothetical protein [Flavobacterium yafengii]MDI5887650.1 hypothetical protein [Flavobacterium yafengii]